MSDLAFNIVILICCGTVMVLLHSILRGGAAKDEYDEAGIRGELIWKDEGRQTQPFLNHTFKILGKPDLMYRIPGGIKAVEYKHRWGPVFSSDVAQALTAALAARHEGYKVIEVECKTKRESKIIPINISDRRLFAMIEGHVSTVRRARRGETMMCKPDAHKCRACSYVDSCDKR